MRGTRVVPTRFAQFNFVHYPRLGFLAFNPACFSEGFSAFLDRPFSDGLALAHFSALASISIRLRKSFATYVHMILM